MSIHPATRVGTVSLTVQDLERSVEFYETVIGLTQHRREGRTAYLGADGQDLLALGSGARTRVDPRASGLYHFALLVPSRLELARTLAHLLQVGAPISGFADHAVSEAIYLSDPNGHGIEIYRDRRRDEWSYDEGQLKITNDPFDQAGVLAELRGNDQEWAGLHADTTVGHIHLRVAEIAAAERFYIELLGFEPVARWQDSAAFIATGGYHHHIAFNTWGGVGARPPAADAARLVSYQIRLPTPAALGQLLEDIAAAGVQLREGTDEFLIHDPSGNGISLVAG